MVMPALLHSRFLQPQSVSLIIKGWAPFHTNIIILCGISLGLTIILILRRKRQHGRLSVGLLGTETWDTTEDHEKRMHAKSPSSSLPWLAQPITNNKVNFRTEMGEGQQDRTTTSMSQTPQTDNSDEQNGEIVIAEGWRRHTRVYGGGVCQACVESEERMKAMNLSLQNRPPQEAGPGGGKTAENSSQEQSR